MLAHLMLKTAKQSNLYCACIFCELRYCEGDELLAVKTFLNRTQGSDDVSGYVRNVAALVPLYEDFAFAMLP